MKSFLLHFILMTEINVLADINLHVSTNKDGILNIMNEFLLQKNICNNSSNTYENKINCTEIFHKYGLYSMIEDKNISHCSETFREELYEMLCRGDYQLSPKIYSKLKCFLQNYKHSFLKIAPFKVEEIYHDPEILMYHDFVNDQEIEKIKSLTAYNMVSSRTISANGQQVESGHRKSKTTFLDEEDEEVVLGKVVQRIADSTMLSMDSSEVLQVAKYDTGGYYKTHLDFFTHPKVLQQEKDNRIATFLIYLNDVVKGGYTVFPMLKLHVKPKKGTAIFWYNLFDSGIGDIRMLHGSCEVVEGIKWISTKWIREAEQVFKRPCSIRKKLHN